MAKFEVMVEEILARFVEVEAPNEDAAIEEVRRMYKDGEIVLDYSDLVEDAQFSIA